MKNTITQQQLIDCYKMTIEFCKAKYGPEPDKVIICEDGNLEVMYSETCRGQYSEEHLDVKFEDLNRDLIEVFNERKQKELEERSKELERQRLHKIHQDSVQKAQRKAEYLKLKKEFE